MRQHDPKTRHQSVEEMMAALSIGDGTAIEALVELATTPIRGILIRAFHALGTWITRDQLDDIVRDCIIELARLAPGWRPDGGAAPWNWARPRLVAFAFHKLDILADDIDDHIGLAYKPDPAPCSVDSDITESFRAIQLRNPLAARLGAALNEVVPERDQRIWLEVLHERSNSNRSPATTVAAANGVTPANVRKICQRTRERVVSLASRNPKFRELLDLLGLAA